MFEVRSRSHDETFLDFYEPLAQNLQDSGTLYTPYPAIPPEVRFPTLITRVLVGLGESEDFTRVYQTVDDYLKGDQDRELTLEKGDIAIVVTAADLPKETTLVQQLFGRDS